MKIWLTALLLLCAQPCWPQSEPLGRLFFTPDQRATLDRQRLQGDTRFDQEASYTLNGEVRRSAGPNTRWINGQALTTGSAPRGVIGDTYHPTTGERESLIGSGRIIVRPPH